MGVGAAIGVGCGYFWYIRMLLTGGAIFALASPDQINPRRHCLPPPTFTTQIPPLHISIWMRTWPFIQRWSILLRWPGVYYEKAGLNVEFFNCRILRTGCNNLLNLWSETGCAIYLMFGLKMLLGTVCAIMQQKCSIWWICIVGAGQVCTQANP